MCTFATALAVFAAIQDRITAGGTDLYVRAHAAAALAGTTPPTIDSVMQPVVARSVRVALAWSGAVAVAGLLATAVVARRPPRG